MAAWPLYNTISTLKYNDIKPAKNGKLRDQTYGNSIASLKIVRIKKLIKFWHQLWQDQKKGSVQYQIACIFC